MLEQSYFENRIIQVETTTSFNTIFVHSLIRKRPKLIALVQFWNIQLLNNAILKNEEIKFEQKCGWTNYNAQSLIKRRPTLNGLGLPRTAHTHPKEAIPIPSRFGDLFFRALFEKKRPYPHVHYSLVLNMCIQMIQWHSITLYWRRLWSNVWQREV